LEKYRASKNNFEDTGEQTQDEKNIESNRKVIESAKEIGKKIPVPQVKAAAHAIDKVDKLTGGAATNTIAKGVSDISKRNPAMNQIQNASNKMNDSGVSDALNQATSTKTAGGLSKTSKKNNSSFMSNNIMSNFKLGKSLKMKLIIVGVIVGFFLLFFVALASATDFHNLDLTNKSEMVRKSASSADVLGALEEVANWYIENVPTYTCHTDNKFYECRKFYDNPFTERDFADDCSEFASLYMSYVCGVDAPQATTLGMVDPNGSYAKTMEECGWIPYTSDEIDSLQPGDVLIANSSFSYSKKGHHAEIYINESQTFGWGSIKKSYPTSNTITKREYGGHVHFEDSGHDYITVYRYAGAVNIQDMNIVNMNDASFNHGTKPKENQKYIMLHDTEMSENAETVVNSWKNSGNGVAAHFVIDRDGTIIQAVDLDVIAHHAGWGGPGNYDFMFEVGNNDGTGNGDDLVGQKTGAEWSGYTSYGMNSYSIGIELCHVNGEDYPELQLKALDKVIAYIDSYYGFKSTIIDHKAWRPSNSDTDVKFSEYLNNYKTLRHY